MFMPKLNHLMLDLSRCPHCNVDRPRLSKVHELKTNNFTQTHERCWRIYVCGRCGGIVSASAGTWEAEVREQYPGTNEVDTAVSERAKEYLEQAINSLSSPAGAVMLAASSVDAMLKAKGLKDGTLYSRIDEAAKAHLITAEMALWAHEVRLDANDQRHSDEAVPLPTTEDAKRSVEFAQALAQFLFVLPARVQRGINQAKPK